LKLHDTQIRKLFSSYQQEVYALKTVNNNDNNQKDILNDEGIVDLDNIDFNDYRYHKMNRYFYYFYPQKC
jgi:hypothetical protein